MLALVLATFTMLAITKVAFDILYGYNDVENATLVMILGSLLALYLAVGIYLPGLFKFL